MADRTPRMLTTTQAAAETEIIDVLCQHLDPGTDSDGTDADVRWGITGEILDRLIPLLRDADPTPAAPGEELSPTYLACGEAAELMTMWWTETLWLPFVDSERCDITGPGHQDPAQFVAAVHAYDVEASGNATHEAHSPEEVTHRYIRVRIADDGEWAAEECSADDPDAIAVTTIWGVR